MTSSPARGPLRRYAVEGLLFALAVVAVILAASCGSDSGSEGRGAGGDEAPGADTASSTGAPAGSAGSTQALPSDTAPVQQAGEAPRGDDPSPAPPPALAAPAPAPPAVAEVPVQGTPLRIPDPAPRSLPAQRVSRRIQPLLGGPGSGGPADVAAVSPVDAGPQEILLDLRFGRLVGTTVQAYANGNVPLLPAFAFMELAEIDVRPDSTGALRATLHPGGRPVYLSGDSTRAWTDEQSVALEADDVLVRGEEIFVATTVLEELLDLTIRTDWVSLVTTVLDPDDLPLARRLAREARWERIRNRGSAGPPASTLDLDNSLLGGAILDWSVSNNVRTPDRSLAYSLALGTRILEGSLQVSARSLGPVSIGDDRFDATYERVFRDMPWLTQMRLGDGFTTGPRLRNVRGFALTNAPYLRGADYTAESFRGQVGPGWDVELRQSGQIVDLTRADEEGAFALDIPLRYGENAIQVVAFGPHGEIVTTDRLMLAGAELIPGGAFEWGLSGGACRDERCDATGNLDLRWGVSDRLTVRGGTEAFTRPGGGSVIQPYLKATGLILPSLQLSAEGVQAGFLRAGSIFAPSPWLRVRGAYTAFSSSLEDPLLHDARRRSTTEADVFFRPKPDEPRLFLRASLLNQELDDADRTRIQASAVVPVGKLAVEGGVRRDLDDPVGPVRTTDDFQFGALFGNVRVQGRHRLWLRGEVEFREAEALNRLRAQISYQLSNRLRVNVAAGWQKFFGSSLTLTFNAFLSELRSVVQLNSADGAETQLTQFSQGTVYWNEATRQVDFAPGPGIQRGGLSGYVFLDANGNGIRDSGEEGLEGVRLVVGGRPVVTDAQGRHSSWDLVPYQRVDIWTDSASIADPSLVPERSRVRVDVPPSSFGRVDVPVTPSRQIAGTVLQVPAEGGPGLAIPYAELELVELETEEVRSFRAFSDGQFYEASVRPGRYELRLDRDYMNRAGLLPEATWPVLEVTPDDPFEIIGPVELRVIRRQGPAGDDGWIEAPPAENSSSEGSSTEDSSTEDSSSEGAAT